MPSNHRPGRIMLVAGEASGDGYGALLARELRALLPGVRLFGMGGPRMRAAGVHLLYDPTGRGTIGFFESLRDLPLYRRLLLRLVEAAARLQPASCVCIDFPGFNLRLGPSLKRLGIPVVYYIAPAVWAWGASRSQRVAAFARKVVCAFDFEVPLYRKAGADACFLGHPILDELPQRPDRREALAALGRSPEVPGPVIALLPGSRRQEIERLYRPMLEAARLIAEHRPDAVFVTSVAPGLSEEYLQAVGRRAGVGVPVQLVSGGIWRSLAPADLAVVASGTATLQAALWQVPMVAVYQVSSATYELARRLVRIRQIALPNIVMGRPVVTELLQGAVDGPHIARAVLEQLGDPRRLEAQRRALGEVRRRLGTAGASGRAARLVLEAAGLLGEGAGRP